MKLRKVLTVAGEAVKLVSEDIRLDLYAPGRAVFQVQAAQALGGKVSFALGYSAEDKDQAFFAGYVERSLTVDSAQQRLMCRELVGVLDADLPISLRHPTLKAVLQAYAGLTGLVFAIPERAYANQRVPCFMTLGNGYHGLDAIGGVFSIDDYVWFQQGDGSVFVGSWQDTRWATRPIDIPDKWFAGITADGGARLPALPALRPGALLNGQYLLRLQLTGHEMVVQCSRQLKKPF
jgi:hypothetical protein